MGSGALLSRGRTEGGENSRAIQESQGVAPGRIELLYLASSSFSGSTLLTLLLAAHRRIATIGELKATAMGDIDRYRCSCGARIRGCAYWADLGALLARRGVPFDLSRFGTHFRSEQAGSLADRALRAQVRGPLLEAARSLALRVLPGASRELQGILERNRALIDAVCALRGASIFLDGSKEPNRLQYLSQSAHWPVKFVHLVRDGRGVLQSMIKRVLRRPRAARRSRPSLVAALARHWRRVNLACERVIARLPAERWVRVRYEDVCREPQGSIQPIFRLLGIDPIELPEDFREIEHHILGNYMRLKDGRIALDEQWRTALSPEDLATFERVAGRINRRYGYV